MRRIRCLVRFGGWGPALEFAAEAYNSATAIPSRAVKIGSVDRRNPWNALRRLRKFLHTIGAIGLMGAIASLLVLIIFAPAPTSVAAYAVTSGAMAAIATWIFFPSLGLTLIAGLLSIAANPPFHNAGWAWVKLASGVLIFEGGLTAVLRPIQEEARRSAVGLAGQLDPAAIAATYGAERGALWMLLAVTTANVVFGIWRPRLIRIAD
jgi:hypothetical protein